MKNLSFFLVFLSMFALFSCTPDNDLIGTWTQEGSWIVGEDTYEMRVEFIFESTTLEILSYGQDNGWVLLPNGSMRMNYSVDGPIINVTITEMLVNGVWTEYSDQGTAHHEISGDEMDLILDYDGDGEYDNSHPFSETFPEEGGPQFDILYELTREL